MELLDRFEKAVEGLWEGMFSGLFPSPLQPIEVGKQLVREMDAQRTRGLSSIMVPNVYLVQMAPETYAKFAMLAPRLLVEMEDFLQRYAGERHYTTVGPIVVEFAEEPAVKANDARIVAGTSPSAMGHAAAPPVAEPPAPRADDTVLLTVTPVLEVVSGPDTGTRVTLRNGFTLGRGTGCDLVLTDRAVSRTHAEVAKEAGAWILRDLNSANHTYHNGKPVATAILKPGDKITVGETVIAMK